MTMIDPARAEAQANEAIRRCPEWCTRPADHDWPLNPHGLSRLHMRDFGPVALVAVDEFNPTNGTWSISTPSLLKTGGIPDDADAEEATQLAAGFAEAVAWMRRVAADMLDGVTA